MGSIVTDHVLHQCQQFLHGSMLTRGVAMIAATGTVMAVVVGVTLTVEVVMLMGMGMIVGMCMGMFMGMGMTIMGMLMGMSMLMTVVMGTAQQIVMNMHSNFSFAFFIIIIMLCPDVKAFIFLFEPPRGLAFAKNMRYNPKKRP
jgi:hypothetical protein